MAFTQNSLYLQKSNADEKGFNATFFRRYLSKLTRTSTLLPFLGIIVCAGVCTQKHFNKTIRKIIVHYNKIYACEMQLISVLVFCQAVEILIYPHDSAAVIT